MTIAFPNIDPVVFHVYGPLAIRWYSLAYVAGILLGWLYLKHLNGKFKLNLDNKFIEDSITYAVIGIVLGGRLGYVIFYDLHKYLTNPVEILTIWNGGLSFHGGLIGLITAMFIASKRYKVNFLMIADIMAVSAPIGIFFGRLANFINGELFGRTTDVSWGIVFPDGGPLPRHPSQLYEAFLEGIIIFIAQYILTMRSKIFSHPGMLSASFLIQYSLYRAVIENFREPDSHIGYIYNFTMGQILSVPMLITALVLIILNYKSQRRNGA